MATLRNEGPQRNNPDLLLMARQQKQLLGDRTLESTGTAELSSRRRISITDQQHPVTMAQDGLSGASPLLQRSLQAQMQLQNIPLVSKAAITKLGDHQ